MYLHRLSLALTLALFSLSPAGAADLSRIDRTLAKEPAYKAKPQYCLLVFGPKAEHRVWLVQDGDLLYVDHNGNGDLTGADKRFLFPAFRPSDHPAHEAERSVRAGSITVGGCTHTDLEIHQTRYRRKIAPSVRGAAGWQEYVDSIHRQAPDGLIWMVSLQVDLGCYGLFGEAKGKRVQHFAWIDQNGQLTFANRPNDAPILHFGGPLTLRVNPTEKLRRGNKPEQVTLNVGTPGLGAGSFVNMNHDHVPRDVHPVVTIRFPAREAGQEPVTRKYVLKQRC
jgi:hypothetical protein